MGTGAQHQCLREAGAEAASENQGLGFGTGGWSKIRGHTIPSLAAMVTPSPLSLRGLADDREMWRSANCCIAKV